MATLETQILDEVIVKSRRKMLSLSATALAGAFTAASTRPAAAQAATYTDADILNFALNLEYLEANFYYLAAFGTTIDVANAASTAAKAPVLALTGVGTQGVVVHPTATLVPFTSVAVGSYATETAVEEGKHVGFLRGALGSAAVAQPQIDLGLSFTALANAATAGAVTTYSPYLNDAFFLLGAYIFEDVGVTAYHGAAALLTSKSNLAAAAGILAVEAYHAGLVRTTINAQLAGVDPNGTLIPLTTQVSALRSTLSLQANSSVTVADDHGLATTQVMLGGSSTAVTATAIVDADANVVAFARNTAQVLNIVTGGGAYNTTTKASVSPAKGIFFPAGLNGLFK